MQRGPVRYFRWAVLLLGITTTSTLLLGVNHASAEIDLTALLGTTIHQVSAQVARDDNHKASSAKPANQTSNYSMGKPLPTSSSQPSQISQSTPWLALCENHKATIAQKTKIYTTIAIRMQNRLTKVSTELSEYEAKNADKIDPMVWDSLTGNVADKQGAAASAVQALQALHVSTIDCTAATAPKAFEQVKLAFHTARDDLHAYQATLSAEWSYLNSVMPTKGNK